jgi:hypothetical protein
MQFVECAQPQPVLASAGVQALGSFGACTRERRHGHSRWRMGALVLAGRGRRTCRSAEGGEAAVREEVASGAWRGAGVGGREAGDGEGARVSGELVRGTAPRGAEAERRWDSQAGMEPARGDGDELVRCPVRDAIRE